MAAAVPPLLLLAEGRRARPRKAPPARPKELALHMRLAAILRTHGRPEWRWAHIPNGELRDARTASKLRAMGVQRGWPDFLLISPAGVAHGLELKRRGGRLSYDQEAFQMWAAANGVAYVVADNFDLALSVLRHWGVLSDEALALMKGAAYD